MAIGISSAALAATPQTNYVSSVGLHDVGGVVWGTYTDDEGVAHDAYTNLQQAIDATLSLKGSTVFVDNNFICDTGFKEYSHQSDSAGRYRIWLDKIVEVRGQSDDWRTGPVIRGQLDPSVTKGVGPNAICGIYGYRGTIRGFRFENCASVKGYTPGGIHQGTAVNCYFKNCRGNYGGAGGGATLIGCTIDSCVAGEGTACRDCTLRDCEVRGCTTGPVVSLYNQTASNCVFYGNNTSAIVITGYGTVRDCTFISNTCWLCVSTGYNKNRTIKLYDSTFKDNTCSGAAFGTISQNYPGSKVEAYNCTVIGASQGEKNPGIAVYGGAECHNCYFSGYAGTCVSAPEVGNKVGPIFTNTLYNCTVAGNKSKGVSGYVHLVNTIVQSPVGVVDDMLTARNSALSSAALVGGSASGGEDCVRGDPGVYYDPEGFIHPRSDSPCREGGTLVDYTPTETDLAGNARTSNGGTTISIGAFEYDGSYCGAAILCSAEVNKAPASGTFTVSVEGLPGDLSYYWDFNGDGTLDLVTNVAKVAYYYPDVGSFNATVSVSNGSAGVSASYPMTVVEGFFVSRKNITPDASGVGWGVYTTDDGREHLAYTNLQQAVDAASPGDVVWVDSDYVWDEGNVTYDSRVTRLRVDKKLVIRGQTGDWRTGPTIRGAYNAPGTTTDSEKCGAKAVTCVGGSSSANVMLVGIRLVGGATTASGTKNDTKGGGAKSVTLKNCLVADCASYLYGGGVYECDTESSVISNCYVGGHGSASGGGAYKGTHTNAVFVGCTTPKTAAGIREGTLYDCVMTNCIAAGTGGASYQTTCYRTRFLNCKANGGYYGGAGYGSTFYGCLIRNCNYAVVGGKMYDTVIDSCTASYTASASGFRPAANSVASNCTFMACTQNTVCPDGAGLLIDCTFTNTVIAVNPREKEINVENCRFFCDYAVGVENGRSWYMGKGYAYVRNSEIHGHIATCGEFYNCLIEGGTNTSKTSIPVVYCNEAMVTNNTTQEIRPLRLYNCTVTRNHSKSSSGIAVGGGYVAAVNSIIWGNTGNTGAVDTFLAASNSCIEASAVVGDEYQCVNCNPRFMGTPGDEYVPRAAKLYGKGQVFDWMSDPEDVRSQDLAGKPRLHEGTVDMGAFAMYPLPGFLLLVR